MGFASKLGYLATQPLKRYTQISSPPYHSQLSKMTLVLIILLRIFFLLVTQGSPVNDSVSSNISLNSTLTPHINPSWFSPSGLFAFGFYPQDDGFAVGIWLTTKPEITVVWTAYRDRLPFSSNSTIEFNGDGLLLLLTGYSEQNSTEYQFDSATSVSMFDSGNFVVYNHSEVIWQSFDYHSDTIIGGQKLAADYEHPLYSSVSASQHSRGRFVLHMQYDGNLVAYPRNNSESSDDSYWSTATYSTYYESLNLNRSGYLYMVGFDEPHRVLNPHTSSPLRNNETVIYRATLNSQGNFILYSHIFTTPPSNLTRMNIEWAALQNPCKVRGVCGVNSYCSFTSVDSTECNCFPGFSFLNNTINGKVLGCYRGFTDEEACSLREQEFSYNITALENIELQVLNPYSIRNLSKNACSKSCLDDCNCWASLYADGACKKLKDPITNALLDKSVLATVFIKVRVPQTASMNIIKQVVERKKLVSVLAIAFGFLALMCTLMAFSSFFFYRVHAHRYESVSENVGLGFISDHLILRAFSFDELQKATDGFKEVIGRNSNGEVYKGLISEGKKAVAVKRLEKMFEGGEFQAEITAIAQTHHRNLVRLLGFCMHGATKLLVYEFMSNGSLADLLLAQPGWKERVRVALDVARGILYLHQECETRIIHCNIKPHNILFDESWTAKVSDFGLSKPLSPNQSGTLTSVRGTRGYLAPEWFKNTLISTKVDIYSFGVVLLEILCCTSEMGIDVSSEDKTPLTTWVYNCFAANELIRLIGDDNDDEAVDIHMFEKMVKVGLLCIQDDPEARPSIRDVILMLEGTTDIPIPPSPIPLVTSHFLI
ncbi:hypothetical protein L1987_56395 [Smallanthus sonchifolius]|uniref:Uncharacterized protein n=1 Tax=Smallanthus sonchifolius TaxID=185202 RepID=A0ACB9ECB5_9ASTR|nr:hypothetical protein L1987_56395 [Smallanthus sonchifolius]